METGKNDLFWLVSGVTVLQETDADLVLIVDRLVRRESADEQEIIPILVQNVGSSIIRDVEVQTECSPVANLERTDLNFKEIYPHETAGICINFRPKKVKLCDKNIEIGETIEIGGRLTFTEETVPVKKTNLFISLTDKRGCILHSHVQQCRTNEEGQFKAEVDTKKLRWPLRYVHFTFYTELRVELTFKYWENEKEHCSKKTVIASCFVEDSDPSVEELKFNLDQLQAEIWELEDLEEECKWEWSMVPVIRKQREKPSSILTNCEVCKKYIGVGKKRFKQCSHCGRWIGVKCDSCWDSTTIFKRTRCIACADIHRRSLEVIRESEPKT